MKQPSAAKSQATIPLDPATVEMLVAATTRRVLAELAAAGGAVTAANAGDIPMSKRSEVIDEWVELSIAAARLGCHVDTMKAQAAKYGIGCKVGGRWKVDMIRARAWREGRAYAPLASDAAG